jgi:hypothetical protein
MRRAVRDAEGPSDEEVGVPESVDGAGYRQEDLLEQVLGGSLVAKEVLDVLIESGLNGPQDEV